MKFYNESKLLYIETDASGIGLGAALVQTRDNMNCHRHEVPDNSILRPIAFASKTITGAKKRYSNIEREALGILYGLEKFHHYCRCSNFLINRTLILLEDKLLPVFKHGFFWSEENVILNIIPTLDGVWVLVCPIISLDI